MNIFVDELLAVIGRESPHGIQRSGDEGAVVGDATTIRYARVQPPYFLGHSKTAVPAMMTPEERCAALCTSVSGTSLRSAEAPNAAGRICDRRRYLSSGSMTPLAWRRGLLDFIEYRIDCLIHWVGCNAVALSTGNARPPRLRRSPADRQSFLRRRILAWV